MSSEFVSSVRQSAEDAFASGLFCAESVVVALARAQGIESELLPKAATAFCSGMARTCGTCGALTGAIMGLGLAFGRTTAADPIQPAYTATQTLFNEFEQTFGARDCHDLLGCNLATPEGQILFREQKLGLRCGQYISKAAEIAARILETTNPDAEITNGAPTQSVGAIRAPYK